MFSVLFTCTLRNGIGSPTSTLWISTLSSDEKFVTEFKAFLRLFKPSTVERSHVSVKSFSTGFSSLFCVKILIVFELRSLQTVEVVSCVPVVKIIFSSNLLINMVFPALVSPEWKLIITNCHPSQNPLNEIQIKKIKIKFKKK